jgi:hypothetical protein
MKVSEETVNQQEQPTRKQQSRSLVTQQKLLDAAVEAFSENGFKGTSTRDSFPRMASKAPRRETLPSALAFIIRSSRITSKTKTSSGARPQITFLVCLLNRWQ